MKDNKTPEMASFLDRMTTDMGFQPRTVALQTSTCVFCRKDSNPASFRDALSLKEFNISGMCQECQDDIFSSEQPDTDPRY